MDDGFREMPTIAKATRSQYFDARTFIPKDDKDKPEAKKKQAYLEQLGESFNHYGLYKANLPPDFSLSMSGGDSWLFADDEQRIGVIGAFRYSNKWSNDDKLEYSYKYNGLEKKINLDEVAVTRDTNNIIDVSAMLNLDWEINDNHKLGINNLLVRHTTSSGELAEVYSELQYIGTADVPDNPKNWPFDSSVEVSRKQNIQWIEEQLTSHQLWGNHAFYLGGGDGGLLSYLGDLHLDWQLASAEARYDRPDSKQYVYSNGSMSTAPTLAKNKAAWSTWEESTEDSGARRLDMSLPVNPEGSVEATVKFGLYDQERERKGSLDQFTYSAKGDSIPNSDSGDPDKVFSPANIGGDPNYSGENGQFVISYNPPTTEGVDLRKEEKGLEKGSRYITRQENDAFYIESSLTWWDSLITNIGVRRETLYIGADQYHYVAEPLYKLVDETKTLPAFGLTWLISDSWQLRSVYSKTVSWPETFEVLPRSFRDVETLKTYQGNPNLKPADIKNYDLRLEWYTSETESVSLAAFYKDLNKCHREHV